MLKTPTQEIVNVTPATSMADRVYQLFGRQVLEEMIEVPETSAPIRAAITEVELENGEVAPQISVRDMLLGPRCSVRIVTALCVCKSPLGARSLAVARDSRGLQQYFAGRRVPDGAAVCGFIG